MSVVNDTLIRQSVLRIATTHTGDVSPEDRLAEDLHLDSMARIELAVLLEEQLGRPVADSVVMKAKTVADLVRELGG